MDIYHEKVQLFLASLPLALSVACGTTNELVLKMISREPGSPIPCAGITKKAMCVTANYNITR